MHALPRTDEQGFSIIEVMISAALLAIVVVALATQQFFQAASRGSAESQMKIRLAVDSVISNLGGSGADNPFPYVEYSDGTVMAWIGCFSEDGLLIGNTWNVRDYTLWPMTTALINTTAGVCNTLRGGFELHIWPESQDRHLEVVAVLIPNVGGGYNRGYTAATSIIRAIVGRQADRQIITNPTSGSVYGWWCADAGPCNNPVTSSAPSVGCSSQYATTPPITLTPSPAYSFCF